MHALRLCSAVRFCGQTLRTPLALAGKGFLVGSIPRSGGLRNGGGALKQIKRSVLWGERQRVFSNRGWSQEPALSHWFCPRIFGSRRPQQAILLGLDCLYYPFWGMQKLGSRNATAMPLVLALVLAFAPDRKQTGLGFHCLLEDVGPCFLPGEWVSVHLDATYGAGRRGLPYLPPPPPPSFLHWPLSHAPTVR